LAAIVLAGACAQLSGLDDYTKASVALCECQFVAGCEAYLDEKIEAMSEQERAAWLKLYAALDCDKVSCDVASQCFYKVKDTCRAMGEACEMPQACCGFDFDAPGKGSQCCSAGDEGVCCAGCHSCQDILGGEDPATLCKSEQIYFDQLDLCRAMYCADKPCETFQSECVMCMQTKCFDQLSACQSGGSP
jgi:hypothetical protein